VIVAPSTPAARAAKDATDSIPVVFVGPSDPVGSGLVVSLSRPGGNVTGLTDIGLDLTGKRLELLKQIVPGLKRVGVLGDPADPLWEPVWREAQASARRQQIDVVPVLVTTQAQLETAFADLGVHVQALHVAPQALFFVHLRRLVGLAYQARLPASYELRAYPEAGGLMSYGPSHVALSRSAARYVDEILRGVKPGDLPVQQPTVYELVINLKTARAMGLTVSQSLLLLADEVIR
jgi:putative ABC transport system substrate-binding protein